MMSKMNVSSKNLSNEHTKVSPKTLGDFYDAARNLNDEKNAKFPIPPLPVSSKCAHAHSPENLNNPELLLDAKKGNILEISIKGGFLVERNGTITREDTITVKVERMNVRKEKYGDITVSVCNGNVLCDMVAIKKSHAIKLASDGKIYLCHRKGGGSLNPIMIVDAKALVEENFHFVSIATLIFKFNERDGKMRICSIFAKSDKVTGSVQAEIVGLSDPENTETKDWGGNLDREAMKEQPGYVCLKPRRKMIPFDDDEVELYVDFNGLDLTLVKHTEEKKDQLLSDLFYELREKAQKNPNFIEEFLNVFSLEYTRLTRKPCPVNWSHINNPKKMTAAVMVELNIPGFKSSSGRLPHFTLCYIGAPFKWNCDYMRRLIDLMKIAQTCLEGKMMEYKLLKIEITPKTEKKPAKFQTQFDTTIGLGSEIAKITQDLMDFRWNATLCSMGHPHVTDTSACEGTYDGSFKIVSALRPGVQGYFARSNVV
jgi:hypothetical protein